MSDQILPGCGCSACQSASMAAHDANNVYSGTVEGDAATSTALLYGTGWFSNNLQYKFLNNLPSYYNARSEEANGFEAFTADMRAATIRILDQIETFTNLTFTEAANENSNNTLTFAQATLPVGTGAWAYYPTSNLKGGDVWTNNYYASSQAVDEGEYGFFTIMHEIGHALGLRHSFEVYTDDEASSRYSVMAYDWSPGFAETFQLYDIAALQARYGANTSHNTGDDNYVLRSGALYTIWDAGGVDTFDASHMNSSVTLDLTEGGFSSVGDSNNIAIAYGAVIENANGGSRNDILAGNDADNILRGNAGNDTFYESAGSDMYYGGIGNDLAVFTTSFSNFIVNFVNSVTVTLQNLATAAITTIFDVEDFTFDGVDYSFAGLNVDPNNAVQAFGSDGRDSFRGTDGADWFEGLGGMDNLRGGDGNDRLYGGDDRDTISGGNGHDELYGDAGDDNLRGDDGSDFIYGGDGNDRIDGGLGHDYIEGGAGDDRIAAKDGNNEMHGGDGNDTIRGANLDDIIYGDAGNDRISDRMGTNILDGGDGDDNIRGGRESDTIYGGAGNDKINGGTGDDILYGGDGIDSLLGGSGNDILHTSAGTNTLKGSAGDDIFVLHTDSTIDTTIFDFKTTNDRLDISDLLTGYDPLNDLLSDFVRLGEFGRNKTIEYDADGAANGENFTVVAQVRSLRVDDIVELDNDGLLIY